MSIKIPIDITVDEARAIINIFERDVWRDPSIDVLEEFYVKVYKAFSPYIEEKINLSTGEFEKGFLLSLADKVRHSIVLYRNTYQFDSDDVEMLDTIESDSEDLLQLASLISQGELAGAVEKAWSLDSVVRDYIPDEVWQVLVDYNQNSEKSDSSKKEVPI